MSRETRTLRPFSAPSAFNEALQFAQFHMGEQICDADSRITIESASAFLRAKPALSWARDNAEMEMFRSLLGAGVKESGISPSQLGLVVTAYSGFLKMVDVCYLARLSDCSSLERLVPLSECRPRALQASTHGATVSAHIALLQQQERRALQPWRKGTWLARAQFRLDLETTIMSIFRPTPMDDAKRQELGLPKGTARYFALNDHDPFGPFGDTESPTFYVDEDLLSRLNAEATSPLSKALQAQLVCDFIVGLVLASNARNADQHEWETLKDSLIGRVVELVAGRNATQDDRENALGLLRTDPTAFIARAEGVLNIKRSMIRSFSVSP